MEVRPNASDLARLNLSLNQLAEETSKTLKEVLPSQMRLLATDLASVTSPKGKTSSANHKAMENIKKRISDIYPHIGRVVLMLQSKNAGAAGKFAGFAEKRQHGKAQRILNEFLPEMNITIGTFDGGVLHQSQREQKKVTKRLVVPGYTRVKSYANKTAKRSGFAKGGFSTAAKSIGGVRGIPGFANRQQAPGSATVTGDGKSLSVTMTNGVKHIRAALNSADESRAVAFRTKQVESVLKRIQDRKVRKAMSNFR